MPNYNGKRSIDYSNLNIIKKIKQKELGDMKRLR